MGHPRGLQNNNQLSVALAKAESPEKTLQSCRLVRFLPGFYPAVWLAYLSRKFMIQKFMSQKFMSVRSTSLPLSDQHLSDRPNRNPRGIKLLRSS
ncbi:MAG: hypothetical protein HC942_21505 [Microcoleus sp. SU_5_6]|nr:hypothetical protein [Microcoleus sp. SU_5_6]